MSLDKIITKTKEINKTKNKSRQKCPKIAIIILNWNGWEDTIKCLESIQQVEYPNYIIVIVDNGSKDSSCNHIKSWAKGKLEVESKHIINIENDSINLFEKKINSLSSKKKLVLIQLDENLGFAGGCNVGIKYAFSINTDYILFLNNDTVVTPSSIEKLVNFLEKYHDYYGATGQIRFYDKPFKVWNCGGSIKWYGGRLYNYANCPISTIPRNKWKRISFFNGCYVLFRTTLFKNIGLLSDLFFFGEEDFEFSQRLKRYDYKIACVYDSIIYHKVGATKKNLNMENIGKVYLYYLNRFINMRNYWPLYKWHLWRFMYFFYIFVLLKMKYKYSFQKIFHFCKLLYHNSIKLKRVDKNIYDQVMNSDFFKDKNING